MVSGSLRLLEPVYGPDSKKKKKYDFFEDMLEGQQIVKKRWADIDDVFNDFTMTQRLLKYLIANEVDRRLWEHKYAAKWRRKPLRKRPLHSLKWNKHDDL